LAGEYADDGALLKEYHFKPYSTWMTDPLFQRDGAGVMAYYQNDHLGTPQRLIGNSGAVVWEARYSAFGLAEVLVDQVENNLRFPGQYFDLESGLHHNYFRDYDSQLGRYVQGDPIGLAGGLNMFGYVSGSPLLYIDPEGKYLYLPVVVEKLYKKFVKICNKLSKVISFYDHGRQDRFDQVTKIRDDAIKAIDLGHESSKASCNAIECDTVARSECNQRASDDYLAALDDVQDAYIKRIDEIGRAPVLGSPNCDPVNYES